MHGFDVWKKKSGLPNITNVGVRFGSVLTMCRAFSSTGSAIDTVRLTVCGTPLWRTYGSTEVRLPTFCSSARTPGSVGPGWPLT